MSRFWNANRRTVLKTIGTGIAAGAGMSGVVSADHRSKGGGKAKGEHLDPLWGLAGVVEDIEAGEEEGEFEVEFPDTEEFPPQIRPDHRVQLHFEEPLFFHFHPAGLSIDPGDIVLFEHHTPDHSVTAFHDRIRGDKRVPEGTEPFSSPILPIGGYWLYRFGEEGVYDMFCGPHEVLGMVMRIVAFDGDGDPPTGYGPTKGPSPFHLFNYLEELGLDPVPFTFPSSLDALLGESLQPENILEMGEVDYEEVFMEFQDR